MNLYEHPYYKTEIESLLYITQLINHRMFGRSFTDENIELAKKYSKDYMQQFNIDIDTNKVSFDLYVDTEVKMFKMYIKLLPINLLKNINHNPFSDEYNLFRKVL